VLLLKGVEMKIYKYQMFTKWAEAEGISNTLLREAILEINNGLYEANLGAGLYKKRIARKGQGKRGGYRTLVAFKQDDRAIFMLGFAKNKRDNISDKELAGLKKLAQHYLSATSAVIINAIKLGELIEVKYDA